MARAMKGSTTRTTGTPAGRSGSERMWSTPAPREAMHFRLGNFKNSPRGWFQVTAKSISSGAPTSGQIRKSRSGASSLKRAAQVSVLNPGMMNATAISMPPRWQTFPFAGARPPVSPRGCTGVPDRCRGIPGRPASSCSANANFPAKMDSPGTGRAAPGKCGIPGRKTCTGRPHVPGYCSCPEKDTDTPRSGPPRRYPYRLRCR